MKRVVFFALLLAPLSATPAFAQTQSSPPGNHKKTDASAPPAQRIVIDDDEILEVGIVRADGGEVLVKRAPRMGCMVLSRASFAPEMLRSVEDM